MTISLLLKTIFKLMLELLFLTFKYLLVRSTISKVLYPHHCSASKLEILDFSLVNCTILQVLHLRVNNFGGEFPKSIANFSSQMHTFPLVPTFQVMMSKVS